MLRAAAWAARPTAGAVLALPLLMMSLLSLLLAACGASLADSAPELPQGGACGADEVAELEAGAAAEMDGDGALVSLLQRALAFPASEGLRSGGSGGGSSAQLEREAAEVPAPSSSPTSSAGPDYVPGFLASCSGFSCLKRYVEAPDSNYAWKDTSLRLSGTASNGVGWTADVLQMTSQRWLTPEEVFPAIWTHGLVVINPANRAGAGSAAADWCTMYLCLGEFGSPRGPPLSQIDALDPNLRAAAELAVRTQTVAAILYSVPEQQIFFAGDSGSPRSEDREVALGWERFRRSNRSEWLLELPMAKAAVRAMDALQDYTASRQNGLPVRKFALLGASKRALTSWHAASVDPRVRAIVAPSKVLNSREVARLAFRSLGGCPFIAQPYLDAGLFDILIKDTNASRRLWRIEDPYEYVERSAGIPKYVIFGAGDEFFMPDVSTVFLRSVPGPKSFLMVPNTGHIYTGVDILNLAPTMSAFIANVIAGNAQPSLEWTIQNGTGEIHVRQLSGPAPQRVELWQARTCDGSRRDFRLHNFDTGENCTRCGSPSKGGSAMGGTCRNDAARWSASPLEEEGGAGSRTWVARVDTPTGGRWAAFFVRFRFGDPAASSGARTVDNYFEQSTEVSVIPQTFPFPDCGDGCTGASLV